MNLILNLGENVNFHTRARYSVLISAIDTSQYRAAQELIDHGYYVSSEEKLGIKRALHYSGRDDMYKSLFEK